MTLKGWVQASVGKGALRSPDCIPECAVQGKCCHACFQAQDVEAGSGREAGWPHLLSLLILEGVA